MINILLLLLLIMNLSFILSSKWKKKFGQTSLVALFLVIIAVYLCALLGVYPYILWITLGTQIPILIYNFFYYKKHIDELKEIVKSPSFFYSIFVSVLSVFLFRGHFVSKWDEFSHWGLYVKNIVEHESLWNDSFTSAANGYPPMISIFQAFVIKLFGGYQESLLFSSIFFLNSFIFLPLMDHLTWKNKWKAFAIMILALCLQSSFFVEYFDTIYVDSILGGIFGIILYLFLKEKTSMWKLLELSILLSVLVLTKEFGIVFVGTFYLFLIIDFLFFRKEEYLHFFKKELSSLSSKIGVAILLILPMLFRISWSIYTNTVYQAYTQMDAISSGFSLPAYTKVLFLTYFRNLRFTFISTGGSYLAFSLLNWVLVFLLLFEVLKQVGNKKNEKAFLFSQLITLFTFACYAVALFLSYLFIFSEYEALRLASYARYLSSVLAAVLIFFFCTQFDYLEDGKRDSKKTKAQVIFYLFFIGLMGTLPIRIFSGSIQNKNMSQKQIEFKEQNQAIYEIPNFVDKNESVYFISIGNDGYRYWLTRYLVTPIKVQNDGYWSLGKPSYEEDIWAQDISVSEWKERLEGFRYIYLDHIDENFTKDYQTIFEDPSTISDQCLYEYNGQAKLVKCF